MSNFWFIIILALIYVLSIIAWFATFYIFNWGDKMENCKSIGDIVDCVEDNMLGGYPLIFIPMINTFVLICGIILSIIYLVVVYFCKLLSLDKLWNKIRNIKIKKSK